MNLTERKGGLDLVGPHREQDHTPPLPLPSTGTVWRTLGNVNLLLLEDGEIDPEGVARVYERRAEHLLRVLGVKVGDTLQAGIVRGCAGIATVTRVGDASVELEVRLTGSPPPPPEVDLILAIPRPKALRRVVQHAAAVGIRRIDLVNAWRVEKSYLASPRLDPRALREQAWLGCEQGATTWLPEISVHRLLLPFLLEVLRLRLAATKPTHLLLAHPSAARYVEAALPRVDASATVVAIGPEGGWIPAEIATFSELGFIPVRLGTNVLRVEAAVTALLAQLELLKRVSAQK